MRPLILTLLLVACGPANRENNCVGDACNSGPCDPGAMRDCYTGHMDTEGVGPCVGGNQMCLQSGQWGNCVGQVLPAPEICTDGIDNNCNGMVDENIDADGDGYTTCGGDCCDSTECDEPAKVNPGAFDVPGNGIDDDCDGIVDNSVGLCDQGLPSNSQVATDYAKAIDICQMASMTDMKWGLIDAQLTLADGTGVPAADAHSIREKFGTNVGPQGGTSMAMISSGIAAGQGQTNPAPDGYFSADEGTSSNFPADFLAANAGTLPNSPGCPAADTSSGEANDPVMMTFKLRVPSNAHSFSVKLNFYTSEFPEWTCSPYNDFFVILLDSTYAGSPPNPTDKNLAFYSPTNSDVKYPVGVNLAHGNTGLFTQCNNGPTGCDGVAGTISTCVGLNDLIGTGMDVVDGACGNGTVGGATGWLTTTGNVVPGEIITLRIAVWDTSDHVLDSLALVDAFTWSVDGAQPGTVIERSIDLPGKYSPTTGLAVPY